MSNHSGPACTTNNDPTSPTNLARVEVLVRYHPSIQPVVSELIGTVDPPPISGLLHEPNGDIPRLIKEAKLLSKYLFKRCGDTKGIRTASEDETTYNPVPVVRVKDSFDETVFDVLYDKMQLRLRLPAEAFFPPLWRINPINTIIDYRCETCSGPLTEPVATNLDLATWLHQIAKEERIHPDFEDYWWDALVKQTVQRPEDLFDWTEKDWDSLGIAHMKNVLQKHVQVYKSSMFNGSNSSNNGNLPERPEWEMELLKTHDPDTYRALLLKDTDRATRQLGNSTHGSVAYSVAVMHNIRRYFYFHCDVDRFMSFPYLSDAAILQAVQEVGDKFEGKQLLDQLQTVYMTFAGRPDTDGVRLSRGILLYGPPGTGKTTLTDTLPKRVGFTPVCPPLASAEVNRSLVGQTEKLLLDLLMRAQRLPHLVCYIAIDEIDGLAPKRDDKSSQSKNDALSVLLSLIGGIKDVKNLVFMASTNRLRQMDEAFLRRMNVKLFVGRPAPSARAKMLSKINKTLKSTANNVFAVSDEDEKNLVIWTTNFSGAALDRLISDVLVHALLVLPKPSPIANQQRSDETVFVDIPTEDLLKIAERVCDQFNFSFGNNLTLPGIFWEMMVQMRTKAKPSALLSSPLTAVPKLAIWQQQEELDAKKTHYLWIDDIAKVISDNFSSSSMLMPTLRQKNVPFSGLLLFDLTEGTVLVENKLNNMDDKIYCEEDICRMIGKNIRKDPTYLPPKSTRGVLQQCAIFAKHLNIDFVQLVNTDLFLMNAAYDDTKVMEVFEEKVSECLKYAQSLVILDMDGLAGMSSNETESSMGTSLSFSVSNVKLYNAALNLCASRSVSKSSGDTVSCTPVSHTPVSSSASAAAAVEGAVNETPSFLLSNLRPSSSAETKTSAKTETDANSKAVWIAIVSQKPQLTRRIKMDLNLKKTQQQFDAEEEERVRQFAVHRCDRCKQGFTVLENEKSPSCQFHDGPLFRSDVCKSDWVAASEDAMHSEIMAALDAAASSTSTSTSTSSSNHRQTQPLQLSELKSKYVYVCCLENYGSQGCRKGFHVCLASGISDLATRDMHPDKVKNINDKRKRELRDKFSKLQSSG